MNAFVEKLQRLAALDAADVAVLTAATASPRTHPRHHDIIREGDRPGPVIVVLEGWAARYKILPGGSRQIMAFLMRGDACDLHVGMLAEMDHGIQAVTNVTVSLIPQEEMARMLAQHPRIARAMYIAQLIDEGTLRAWIVSMGRRTSKERIAHLMCELYLRARSVGLIDGDDLMLPLSQTVLADAVGLTPVHVNRVLRELREDGAMMLQRGALRIENPARLARIAGFDENYLHRRLRAA